MSISYLSAINFNGLPAIAFVPPSGTDELTVQNPVQGQFFYNVTTKKLLQWDGEKWVAFGLADAGAPPTGPAGGDLAGVYPNPTLKPGVIVNADVNDDAEIAQVKIANLPADLAAKALKATTVAAGNGLTGGGDLSANRSLAVGAGTGITVTPTAVSVDASYFDTNYQERSEKGAAGGYAPLDADSHIPTVHLPPLAINEVFTVDSEAEMLALVAERGDMAIRTDNSRTYVLSSDDPTTLEDWKEVQATGQVISVNGQTGVIVIDAASLGAVPTSRQVVAGNGLTGGGALSGNVTLNVVGDANLDVAADQVSVISAPKWTTARTLSLTGDVTGSVSIDGSGNMSLAATVVDGGITDHNDLDGRDAADAHPMGAVTGLNSALAGKAPINHNHDGDYDPLGAADAAEAAAKTYADDRDAVVLRDAEDYADGQDNLHSTADRAYADSQDLAHSAEDQDYADAQDDIHSAADRGYTNTIVANLAKQYAGNVPAGTSAVITHNLNSRDVTVEVYRNAAPYDTVVCDVERTSTSTVTLKFAEAVTASQFRVVVQGR